MKTKKFLSILMTAVMLISMFSLGAFAASEPEKIYLHNAQDGSNTVSLLKKEINENAIK